MPVTKSERSSARAVEHRVQRAGNDLSPGEVHHQRQRHHVEHLAQGRDAQVALADGRDLGQVQVTHRGVDPPETLQQLVVQHHDRPVPGPAQVELDQVRPERHGRGEGPQCVLPLADRVAPVRDGGDPRRRLRRRLPPRWR